MFLLACLLCPKSDEECVIGARNRAISARKKADADWGVGIEGGVQETSFGLLLTAWAVVVDKEGKEGVGGSGRLPLPAILADHIRQGAELGPLLDELLSTKKQ